MAICPTHGPLCAGCVPPSRGCPPMGMPTGMPMAGGQGALGGGMLPMAYRMGEATYALLNGSESDWLRQNEGRPIAGLDILRAVLMGIPAEEGMGVVGAGGGCGCGGKCGNC